MLMDTKNKEWQCQCQFGFHKRVGACVVPTMTLGKRHIAESLDSKCAIYIIKHRSQKRKSCESRYASGNGY